MRLMDSRIARYLSPFLNLFKGECQTISYYSVWLFSYLIVVYVCGHVFCMYCSCSKNHSGQRIVSYKYKNCCVLCMHGIHVFDRNVWFANCLAILYQDVGNTVIYLRIPELKLFPLLYILLLHCHQYQIHCSMTILHTYTICYSYITVGVSNYTECEEEC